MFALIFQRLLLEGFLDLVYFPVWWYTRGLKHAAIWCFELIKSGNSQLGPVLWLVNLFTPMYGQYDWQGRIISFFMRLFNVFGRGLALLFWIIFCFILFLFWLLLPLFIVFSIYYSMINNNYIWQ